MDPTLLLPYHLTASATNVLSLSLSIPDISRTPLLNSDIPMLLPVPDVPHLEQHDSACQPTQVSLIPIPLC